MGREGGCRAMGLRKQTKGGGREGGAGRHQGWAEVQRLQAMNTHEAMHVIAWLRGEAHMQCIHQNMQIYVSLCLLRRRSLKTQIKRALLDAVLSCTLVCDRYTDSRNGRNVPWSTFKGEHRRAQSVNI